MGFAMVIMMFMIMAKIVDFGAAVVCKKYDEDSSLKKLCYK